mmetsp:Transcript_42910/g.100740  ORF Transcript_42910/g.100740 Transcript_42910/m.100740 type:complete len:498 (-) Transcript_42910:51-1544(-)
MGVPLQQTHAVHKVSQRAVQGSMDACYDKESPSHLVAGFIRRSIYRRVAAPDSPALQHVVVLFSGYHPKIQKMAAVLNKWSAKAVSLSLPAAAQGADFVADLLDRNGFMLQLAIPLVESAVAVSDVLNVRVGAPANNPATSLWRRDKFLQQERIRAAGLPSVRQCSVTTEKEAIDFFAKSAGAPVVVKPRDASGGDGVWLCDTEGDVIDAFALEIGAANVEDSVNHELIVMEAMHGEEWVVNTVSLHGQHRVVDVWHGSAKPATPRREVSGYKQGPWRFVYDTQFLALPRDTAAPPSPRLSEVIRFTFAALDAVEFQFGAAHTEIVWHEGQPRLLEINPRCAGGLPRGPHAPNQLEMLAMSFGDPARFLALPIEPETVSISAAVVFLRSPFDGWLTAEALQQFAALPCFHCFDKGLAECAPPFRSQPVLKTVSYFTSPGCIVLHGSTFALKVAVQQVRDLENSAYIPKLQPSCQTAGHPGGHLTVSQDASNDNAPPR